VYLQVLQERESAGLALPPGYKGPHLECFSPRQDGFPAAIGCLGEAKLSDSRSGVRRPSLQAARGGLLDACDVARGVGGKAGGLRGHGFDLFGGSARGLLGGFGQHELEDTTVAGRAGHFDPSTLSL